MPLPPTESPPGSVARGSPAPRGLSSACTGPAPCAPARWKRARSDEFFGDLVGLPAEDGAPAPRPGSSSLLRGRAPRRPAWRGELDLAGGLDRARRLRGAVRGCAAAWWEGDEAGTTSATTAPATAATATRRDPTARKAQPRRQRAAGPSFAVSGVALSRVNAHPGKASAPLPGRCRYAGRMRDEATTVEMPRAGIPAGLEIRPHARLCTACAGPPTGSS